MARSRSKRRKKQSGSMLGLFVLEVVALVVFYVLFTQARDYREANSPATIDAQPVVAEQIATYQMYEQSPLQNLLANHSAESSQNF